MSRLPAPSPTAISLLVAALLAPWPAGAQPTPGPEAVHGIWEGSLDTGAGKLRLVFHVLPGEDGSLSGAMDSPDQGATGIPASAVSVEGSVLHMAWAALGASYQGTVSEDGTTLVGTFSQCGANLPLTLVRVEAATQPDRPQNPVEPFPYDVMDVEVTNLEAGVTLAGTLTLPQGSGPFPAAVLVSGSGPQDRDEALMGHKPFLVLADHLTRQGIAVLRYDDRGVGASTGSFATATSEDFASDALAAVAFLKQRPDVGPVGIVGHSEGGLIGPLAASRSAAVAFVVMLAGPGITGEEIIQLQSDLIARADGASDEVVEANLATQRKIFEVVRTEPDPEVAATRVRAILQETVEALPPDVREAMGDDATPAAFDAQVRQVSSPWFRFFLTYDPRPTLEQVTVPVLALNGELDLQVPPEVNLREVSQALTRGGNSDFQTLELPGLNHLFQTAGSGSPTEYAQITETMSPTALNAVSDWILTRFGGG